MARIKTWIGVSVADVGIRLASQLLGTVVIARLLPAEAFGLAMLALSLASLLGAFVSLPFEEALAQRRHVTTGHLRTALFISLVLSLGALLFVLVIVRPLADWAGAPGLVSWLPLATLFLIGQGPSAIARALARRHRRFVELALCQSLSVVVGTLTAVGLAFAGYGVLALVLQRMLPIVLFPTVAAIVALQRGRQALLRPAFIRPRFREIFRFSSLNLVNIAVEYTMPPAMALLVSAQFGTTVLGQLNIAMRLAEPLRLGIHGVGYNLVFSLLVRMQSNPPRLARASLEVVTRMTIMAVPLFLGLAVVAPIALPILVGPGWGAAIPLAQAFCIVAAINVPFVYLYTGFSALGRPEFDLAGNCLGIVVMILMLTFAARADRPVGIGVAVIASELVAAWIGIVFCIRFAGWSVWGPVFKIARVWIAASLMAGLLADALSRFETTGAPLAALTVTVGAGVVLYPAFLSIICRPCFRLLKTTIVGQQGNEV